MMLAYVLMLIVMTFNFWLLLAGVLGLTTGYFVFGFKPLVFERVEISNDDSGIEVIKDFK